MSEWVYRSRLEFIFFAVAVTTVLVGFLTVVTDPGSTVFFVIMGCGIWALLLFGWVFEVTLAADGGLEFRSVLWRRRTSVQAVRVITVRQSEGARWVEIRYMGGTVILSGARQRDLVPQILELNPAVKLREPSKRGLGRKRDRLE